MTTTVDGALGVTTPLLKLTGSGTNTLQPAAAGTWTQTLPSGNGELILSTVTVNMPTTLGTSGDVLTTDGAGNLTWAAGGGGGVLPIAQGGTNATTAAAALNNLLPTQTAANKDAYLTTDGAGNISWSIPRNITRNNYIVYAASGTYTPNSSVLSFSVVVLGATGGRAAGNTGANGGVGGPGYSEKTYTSSFAGTYTVTIGAAGTSAGTAGGDTSFQISGVGPYVTGSAGITAVSGTAGGVATGGDVNYAGGAGGNGILNTAGGGGGNAASGITPGNAGTSLGAGTNPNIYPGEGPWAGGLTGQVNPYPPNPTLAGLGGSGANPYSRTTSTLYSSAYPGSSNITSGWAPGGGGSGNNVNGGKAGQVFVIEYY